MEPSQPKKVIVFGTFDLLHAGHENMFEQARTLGEYIVAVIARDDTVKKIKGHYPCYNERQRAKNLKNSGLVDKVILGSVGDKHEVIRKIRPDVIALGYDQFAFTYQLEKFLIDEKMNTQIERLTAYKPEMYKSSIIRATMLEKQQRIHGDLDATATPQITAEDIANANTEIAFMPHY